MIGCHLYNLLFIVLSLCLLRLLCSNWDTLSHFAAQEHKSGFHWYWQFYYIDSNCASTCPWRISYEHLLYNLLSSFFIHKFLWNLIENLINFHHMNRLAEEDKMKITWLFRIYSTQWPYHLKLYQGILITSEKTWLIKCSFKNEVDL